MSFQDRVVPCEVTLIDHMGSDLTVVNAARVSFAAQSNEFVEKDARLLKYLAKHNHWSPFAHTSIQLRIKAPIFVARQLVKHQVGGVWNEISRRYVDFPPEYYIPSVVHDAPENAKQGVGGVFNLSEMVIRDMTERTESIDKKYSELIGIGVAPEEARIILPLNSMTEWYWTGSLIFFDRVITQRTKGSVQGATREVAELIEASIQTLYPVAYAALRNKGE